MSGTTRLGAKRNLLTWIILTWIIDTCDDLDPAGPLSSELKQQLFVIGGFIRSKDWYFDKLRQEADDTPA